MKIKGLYVIIQTPYNRAQRRIAQKETNLINKIILPIFEGYKTTFPNGTDDETFELCHATFLKEARYVNSKNKYIIINEKSFIANFKTEKEVVFEKNRDNKVRFMAIFIIAFIITITLLIIKG